MILPARLLPVWLGTDAQEAQYVVDSIHDDCLLAVQAEIRGLGLAGLDSQSVVVSLVPLAKRWFGTAAGLGLAYPGILICPLGAETVRKFEGTNTRDHVGYPVLVVIVDAANQQATANARTYLNWRERISRRFRNQRLAGVETIVDCDLEPGDITYLPDFLSGVWASWLVLRFKSRQTRG